MTNPDANEEENASYKRAKARVGELRGFYSHLMVYLVVNVGLFAINMLTSRGSLWLYGRCSAGVLLLPFTVSLCSRAGPSAPLAAPQDP